MVRWYAATMLVAAFLMFLIQPMVGKMLLPHVGGAPAVWNTCMVFFQAALLGGYAYSHWTTRLLSLRQQVAVHLALIAVPILLMPIAVRPADLSGVAGSEYPMFVLLKVLAIRVGFPFFLVSTTAPMLQRWFAQSHHASASDPYYLYTASNLGSFLALALYPTLIEPWLGLERQGWTWTGGYAVFAAMMVACFVVLHRSRSCSKPAVTVSIDRAEPTVPGSDEPRSAALKAVHHEAAPTSRRRLRWILLAFVPSSLMLGVTTHISTDIAPIPLLWVIPLALYLLTFVVAFGRRQRLPFRVVDRVLPILMLALTLVILTGATALRDLPVGLLLGLHLVAFWFAAMLSHSQLAQDRPGKEHLTEFYLWLSLGGVLGGLFNALVAPVLFSRTGLTEYPAAIILACLLRPTPAGQKPWKLSDLVLPAALGATTAVLILLSRRYLPPDGPWRVAASFGMPCVAAFLFVDRPARFALGIAALMLAASLLPEHPTVHLERNFFGVLRVADANDESGYFRVLYHGNTVHGEQSLDRVGSDGRHEPRTYYHRSGPMGRVFERWLAARPSGQRVGIVGLGTGSMAYYARAGDDWTFYEIDPAIKRIAANPNYFTYLSECRTDRKRIILGDARLRLREESDASFDLLVIDAFNSDAIPMHLLTREAFAEYLRKLKPDGALAFHVSNRYLNLPPIVARVAEHHMQPLVVRGWDDTGNRDVGRSPSQWLIVAGSDFVLSPLFVRPLGSHGEDPFWQRVKPLPGTPLWSDDFSNIVRAITWGDRDEFP